MRTTSSGRGFVAGIDGSDSAINAARWAACLAQRYGDTLHLVHVERASDDDRDAADAALAAAEAAARDSAGGIEIHKGTLPGTPGRTLAELSENVRMIVLGHTTTSELQSMFHRSDVVYVANHAACPVVTWRGEHGFVAPDTRPVVIGVDGTALSSAAIAYGYEVAVALDAPIVAVTTWTEQSTLTYGEGSRFVDWTEYAEHRKAFMVENLAGHAGRHPDVQVTHRVERGKPDITLLDMSAEAQLVVVGSHGRSPQAAALFGSTSQNLIHHSHCPVMVCRTA